MSDDQSERVLLDVRDTDGGKVAYVTLNRAAKYNGLDPAMMRALVAVPKRIAADRDIRAVVLAGDGPAFCSGLDFAAMGKAGPTFQLRGFAKLPGQTANFFQKVAWAWRELPVPVVAVIHGPCFGGGLQLALAADFRFATPDAQLSVMEAKWGLIPDMSGSVTLRELVPIDVAKRLAMTAEVLDGQQALAYGLVTGVSDEPLKDAEALVAELLTRSPDALASTKRLFHTTWTRSARWAFWTESVLQARLLVGTNHKIARKAGLAKELPRWVGRKVR